MIDDSLEVAALISQIKAALPLPAIVTERLRQLQIEQVPQLAKIERVEIADVHYLGDPGGIVCALKCEAFGDDVVLTSITHLHFYKNMPLAMEIGAYQKRRIKNLKKAQTFEPHTSFLGAAAEG